MGAGAQTAQLTLRQAIDRALGQNPEAAVAQCRRKSRWRLGPSGPHWLLPQLGFTEDISRGDDPVYAFGMRLRQRQFTQADFALNELNRPQPIGNFLFPLLRLLDGLRFIQDAEGDSQRRPDAEECRVQRQGRGSEDRPRCGAGLRVGALCRAEIDVAQHEQETAAALLSTVEDHVKAGLGGRVGPHVGRGKCGRAQAGTDCGPRRSGIGVGAVARGDGRLRSASRQLCGQSSRTHFLLRRSIWSWRRLQRHGLTCALRDAQSAQATAVGAAKSSFGPHVSAYGNWEEDRGPLPVRAAITGSRGYRSASTFALWQARGTGARDSNQAARRCAVGELSAARASRSQPGAHSSQDRGVVDGDGPSGDGSSRGEPAHPAQSLYGGPGHHHRFVARRRCDRAKANPTTGIPSMEMPRLMLNCFTQQGH